MSAFRESSVIVIESSRRRIRAGVGVNDFVRAPSIEILARVGLRKTPSTSKVENEIETSNGSIAPRARNGNDFRGHDEMANGYQNSLNERTTPSSKTATHVTRKYSRPCKTLSPLPNAKVSDYLVGQQLDDALASGENVEIYWPLDDGDNIRCWPQVEALWKYILFTRLGLRRKQNESPVALCVPCYPRKTHELLAQLFFERLNVAAFMLVERPLMQIYSTSVIHGVVIDISYSGTTITPIVESLVQYNHATHIDLGMGECEAYLVHIFRSHHNLIAAISEGETLTDEQLNTVLLELTRQIWRDGLIKVPSDGETAQAEDEEGVTDIAALLVAGKEKVAIEAGTKRKLTAKQTQAERERERELAQLDLVQVEFKGKTLTLGRERHRFCEPLFDPNLLNSVQMVKKDPLDRVMPLQEGVHVVVNSLPYTYRYSVWSGVFVTGEVTIGVKGLSPALQSRLFPYLLTDQNGHRHARMLNVPEYFGDYRDKDEDLAAFLGTSIVAKVAFNEPSSKDFLSKADYNLLGPRAILEFSPALY